MRGQRRELAYGEDSFTAIAALPPAHLDLMRILGLACFGEARFVDVAHGIFGDGDLHL